MTCRTMFHDILFLVKDHMPHEKKFDFYSELLSITNTHGIKLDFLVGEDEEFDKAFQKFTTEP
jgi:hypothetical protein